MTPPQPDAPPADPPPPWRHPRTVARLLAAVAFAGSFVVLLAAPTPYVALTPGPVFNALGDEGGKPVIQVSGAQTFPTDGRLDITTVSETGGPRGWLSLAAVMRSAFATAHEVVPSSVLFPPDTTRQDLDQQGQVQMDLSQQSAEIAALRYVGYPVEPNVTVASVSKGTPADGKLEPGDVIVEVDGTPVATPDAVRKAVRAQPVGSTITFTIVRDGSRQQVDVVTRPNPEDPSVPQAGFVPGVGYTSSVKLTIGLDGVGGPSAGLVFALGTVDKLTEGALVRGHVAGTGTIDADGGVGPIGGIVQKMAGARRAGATVFLVPQGNCTEALTEVPAGLRLVRVDSLADAVADLQALDAGRDVAGCQASG